MRRAAKPRFAGRPPGRECAEHAGPGFLCATRFSRTGSHRHDDQRHDLSRQIVRQSLTHKQQPPAPALCPINSPYWAAARSASARSRAGPSSENPRKRRVLAALRSGHWGRLDGHEVAEFEERFATMHGCQHGIAVVNGTVSLRLGLMAAGLEAESEVIIPPYTFFSTASAVIEANMVPVFADVDLDTFNLDPRAVEAAITPRTRAVIPVHFAGQVADMDAIMAIAAQAQPAGHRGRRPRPRRELQQPSRGQPGAPGVVLVSIEQEPDLRRGGHPHHQRCGAGRRLPLAAQLRPRARRRVVRASRDFRQLPAGRIARGAARTRSSSGSKSRPTLATPTAGIWRERLANLPGLHPQAAARVMHAARVSSVHAADRCGRVRRAARRRDRRLASRGDSLFCRLRLLAARAADVSQPGVRPVPAGRQATG